MQHIDGNAQEGLGSWCRCQCMVSIDQVCNIANNNSGNMSITCNIINTIMDENKRGSIQQLYSTFRAGSTASSSVRSGLSSNKATTISLRRGG